MEPTLGDGDIVLVNQQQTDPWRRPGIYVINTDGELQIKRLEVHPTNRLIYIKSDNPNFPSWPDVNPDDVEIVGRVTTENAPSLDQHTPALQPPQNHLDFNAIVTPLTATVDNRAVMPEDLSVYGTVECGDGDYMELSDEYKIKRPFVWRDRANEVYALRASGESMTPRFFPGETVYVDTKLKPRHGSEVVIQIHDGNGGIQKAMLKVYIKKTPTVYVFMSYNPDYEQNIEIPVDQVKSVDVIIPAAELVG